MKTNKNRIITRSSTTFNRKQHCFLHECANSNVYRQIINRPPIFQLPPPPNPLNYDLDMQQLFAATSKKHKHNENEQFLLYFLNLNDTTNHSDSYVIDDRAYESHADKCNNLRMLQTASNTYSLSNRYAIKHLNQDFSFRNVTSHLSSTRSVRLETILNNSVTNTDAISSTSNSSSNTNVNDASFSFLLISSISLVTISIVFLLFYVYYYYFHSRYFIKR